MNKYNLKSKMINIGNSKQSLYSTRFIADCPKNLKPKNLKSEDNHKSYTNFRTEDRDFLKMDIKMKLMKDFHEKSYDSVTFSIINNILTNVKFWHRKRNQRNDTKMRNFVILLSSIFKAVNPVQYWSDSHNYTEYQCHTM